MQSLVDHDLGLVDHDLGLAVYDLSLEVQGLLVDGLVVEVILVNDYMVSTITSHWVN